jgi:putative inorganic carbon (HCO3(-)) transporter
MRRRSFLRMPNIWRVGLILLAIGSSLTAGASPLASLIVGGAVIASALGIAFLQNPAWALYAAIFLIFLPQGLIPDSHLHSRSIELALLLALLSWLLNAAFHRRRIIWVSTSLLMAGFLIWSVITLFWAPSLLLGRRELVQYTIGLVLLLLLVNEIDSLQTLDGLMGTLALNGWVLVLAGIGTILSQGYEAGTRLGVLEMNENEFGISLIVTMSGVLWHTLQSSKRQRALKMLLSVIFILLVLVLVALSGSRGSAISLLATLVVFWFWKPTRPWGRLGLLILALAAVSAPFILSVILDRFAEHATGGLGGRLVIWQATRLLIRDHLWRGVGIGHASYAVVPHLGMLTSLEGRERMSIHQPVLQIWAETGILGMLLYLGVLGSAVWLFVRQYLHLNRTRVRSLAAYFALISCVFAGYMLSWIKGGGMASAPSYYLLLALLLIPSRLGIERLEHIAESGVQDAGRSKP